MKRGSPMRDVSPYGDGKYGTMNMSHNDKYFDCRHEKKEWRVDQMREHTIKRENTQSTTKKTYMYWTTNTREKQYNALNRKNETQHILLISSIFSEATLFQFSVLFAILYI
jgi:hypothetical protein